MGVQADGSFVMYYAASLADGSTHCVGAAKSTSVSGPYTAEANYIACPSRYVCHLSCLFDAVSS